MSSEGADKIDEDIESEAHYLRNLPEGHDEVMTKLSGKMRDYEVVAIKEIRNKWKRNSKTSVEEAAKGGNKKEKNHAMNVEKKEDDKNGGGYQGNRSFKGLCRKCGKSGHKAFECRSEKKTSCYDCGKEGHLARDCPEKTKSNEKDLGMFVGMCVGRNASEEESVGSVSNKESFLLDSGASCHVVADETMLSEVKSVNDSLTVGDGTEIAIVKSGTLTLSTESGMMKLSDVRVAPTLKKNIISIGSLEKKGNKIEMSGGIMTITDGTGRNSIKIARNKETLYYLKGTVMVEAKKGEIEVMVEETKEEVVMSREVTWAGRHGTSVCTARELFAIGTEVDAQDDQIGEERSSDEVEAVAVPIEAGRKVPEEGRKMIEEVSRGVAEADQKTESEKNSASAVTENAKLKRDLEEIRTEFKRAKLGGDEEFVNIVNASLDTSYKVSDFSVCGVSNVGYSIELMEKTKKALSEAEAMQWKIAIEDFLEGKIWKSQVTRELREKMKQRGRKAMSSKWLYTKKKRFNMEVVEIMGVDWKTSFAPLASDVSVRTAVLVSLYKRRKKWVTEHIDVEVAFPEGVKEEWYFDWPYGMVEFGFITHVERAEYVLQLTKETHGLVKAPYQQCLLYGEELKKLGLIQSVADTEVWYKVENGETVLMVGVYADDCILTGPQEQVDWLKEEVKKRFHIKELGQVKTDLGGWYERESDDGKALIDELFPEEGSSPAMMLEDVEENGLIEMTKEGDEDAEPRMMMTAVNEKAKAVDPVVREEMEKVLILASDREDVKA